VGAGFGRAWRRLSPKRHRFCSAEAASSTIPAFDASLVRKGYRLWDSTYGNLRLFAWLYVPVSEAKYGRPVSLGHRGASKDYTRIQRMAADGTIFGPVREREGNRVRGT
jgi:hypothetical protein